MRGNDLLARAAKRYARVGAARAINADKTRHGAFAHVEERAGKFDGFAYGITAHD